MRGLWQGFLREGILIVVIDGAAIEFFHLNDSPGWRSGGDLN